MEFLLAAKRKSRLFEQSARAVLSLGHLKHRLFPLALEFTNQSVVPPFPPLQCHLYLYSHLFSVSKYLDQKQEQTHVEILEIQTIFIWSQLPVRCGLIAVPESFPKDSEHSCALKYHQCF